MGGNTVAELRSLLASGYAVEAVESDEERVEAVLRRGVVRVSLTFDSSEAAGLLRVTTPSLVQKRRDRAREWGR